MAEEKHIWKYTDRNKTVLVCSSHKEERYLLTPDNRDRILQEIAQRGEEIAGEPAPAASPPEQKSDALLPDNRERTLREIAQRGEKIAGGSTLPLTPTLAQAKEQKSDEQLPTALTRGSDLIEYTSFEGQQVSLTVRMFREMICLEATISQAFYMLQWCAHNRIDPFANEAYFAIISGKPVIQVSKDAWFKRMERHPSFAFHDSGIIVDVPMEKIRDAVLAGLNDYRISDALRQSILTNFAEGKVIDPKGVSSRLTVKKRGQYLDDKENLLGGWAEIVRKDRPHPYTFTVNKEGWEQKTSHGCENVFWKNKAPFMIWKTALKNCARLTFPELSGLLNAPEAREEMAEIADAEFTAPGTNAQKQALFGAGKKVPAPVGPLGYPELHNLAGKLYDGRGISELSMFETSNLIGMIERAGDGDKQTLDDLASVLGKDTEGEHIDDIEVIEGGAV